MGRKLAILRISCLGFVTLLAVINLALAAHFSSLFSDAAGFTLVFDFMALTIAVGAITIVTVPIMLAIEFLRHGAYTSMIVFEVVWLGILWVLFLASGARTAQAFPILAPRGCTSLRGIQSTACAETAAVIAFNFLAWFILLVYTFTLIALGIKSSNRGMNAWKVSVAQASFSSSPSDNSNNVPASEKPQQQQQQGPGLDQAPPQSYYPPSPVGQPQQQGYHPPSSNGGGYGQQPQPGGPSPGFPQQQAYSPGPVSPTGSIPEQQQQQQHFGYAPSPVQMPQYPGGGGGGAYNQQGGGSPQMPYPQ